MEYAFCRDFQSKYGANVNVTTGTTKEVGTSTPGSGKPTGTSTPGTGKPTGTSSGAAAMTVSLFAAVVLALAVMAF